MHSYQFYTSAWGLFVICNSFEYCGPFIYSTLNKQHLETWSCVCGYCAYGLFLCFCSLWNIPKNARKLGVGCRQFDAGVNGLKVTLDNTSKLQNHYFACHHITLLVTQKHWPPVHRPPLWTWSTDYLWTGPQTTSQNKITSKTQK